jgi:hypothetical protein
MASIADILIAKGNAAAAGTLQRGNIYADLIRNLSSIPGQAMQQQRALEQDRLKQQELQQNLQVGQQNLTLGQQKLAANQLETDADALASQLPRTPEGDLDTEQIGQMAGNHDPRVVAHAVTAAQRLNAAGTAYREAQMKLATTRDDALGEFGLQVKQNPTDLGTFQMIVAEGQKRGLIDKAAAPQMLRNAIEQPGFMGQQADAWISRSKEARAAAEPKITLIPEGSTPYVSQRSGGTTTFGPLPGYTVKPKPPTEAELALNAAKGDPDAAKAMGFLKPQTPRPIEEQLLEAVVKGDQRTINNISTTMRTSAIAKQDPAAAALALELKNLSKQEAQARLDKLREDAKPLDITPNIQTTTTGKSYLDGSTYTGAAHEKAVTAAGVAGVPIINKEQAGALQEVDNARANQRAILSQIESILPESASGRPGAWINKRMADIFQTNEQIAAFGSWRTAAINTLRATAGSKGLRINQAEIAQAIENDIPKLTDTVGVARQKVANITTLLDNVENSIVVRNRSVPVQPAGPPQPATVPPNVQGLLNRP